MQLPSPSTAVSLRTITFRLAIRRTAIDKATVIATGRPSGIAATTKATAIKKTSIDPTIWEHYGDIALKVKKFKELEANMQKNKNPDLPSNFKEYQNNYVILFDTFEKEKDLIFNEMLLINSIGTVYERDINGPLVNKIINARI